MMRLGHILFLVTDYGKGVRGPASRTVVKMLPMFSVQWKRPFSLFGKTAWSKNMKLLQAGVAFLRIVHLGCVCTLLDSQSMAFSAWPGLLDPWGSHGLAPVRSDSSDVEAERGCKKHCLTVSWLISSCFRR